MRVLLVGQERGLGLGLARGGSGDLSENICVAAGTFSCCLCIRRRVMLQMSTFLFGKRYLFPQGLQLVNGEANG